MESRILDGCEKLFITNYHTEQCHLIDKESSIEFDVRYGITGNV